MRMRTRRKYGDAVERVAGMLDRDRPRWEHRIRQEELHLGYEHLCVLGQIYGGYDLGRRSLGRRQGLTWSVTCRSVWVAPWRQKFVRELWLREIRVRKLREATDVENAAQLLERV